MGDGIAHPVAAAGVLAIFVVTAAFVKLVRVLHLQYKAQVVEIDTRPKHTPPCAADHADDVEANELGTTRPSSPPDKICEDSYSLRITARPQTPEDVFPQKLQRHSSGFPQATSRQISGLESLEVDSFEADPDRPFSRNYSERPWSRGSIPDRPCSRGTISSERPVSRNSTMTNREQSRSNVWLERPKSCESIGSRLGSRETSKVHDAHPHISTAYTANDRLWYDPTEFWEADVNEFWDNSQTPWSKASKRPHSLEARDGSHRRTNRFEHIAYSSWPAPQKPKRGAYVWTSFAAMESPPKLPKVACNDEIPSDPPGPHTAPTPSHDTPPSRPHTAPAPSYDKPKQETTGGKRTVDATRPPTWKTFMGFVTAGNAKKVAPKQQQEKEVQENTVGSLVETMSCKLQETRSESLAERKRIFRDLQRQLHPDKNVDCVDEAKLAFQELMQQRTSYLAEGCTNGSVDD